VLEHGDDWDRMLAVVAWFREHPRCGLYLRQLDVLGVDTKFIETRRGVLSELLDVVLPPEALDRSAIGARGFEQRYGLRPKSPLVRLRILDQRHLIHGLSDITIPAEQFATLVPPVDRVFITENETNGLAFPDLHDSMVIFGMGYALDRLQEADWLRNNKTIRYWGDIDTHGFAILDRLRAIFPNARSLLMDRETLMAHRALWVQETERHDGPLRRLTQEEGELFDDLRQDRLGDRVRLEQERIPFGWLQGALAASNAPSTE
jgi:hypothetical protein